MAVTWDFGKEDRLEGRQGFGEEIILREPAAERLHGQCARGQRLEKRSAGCLIPQRPGVLNERMSGQRSFGGCWWFRQFVGRLRSHSTPSTVITVAHWGRFRAAPTSSGSGPQRDLHFGFVRPEGMEPRWGRVR